jgi:hypothetical protein
VDFKHHPNRQEKNTMNGSIVRRNIALLGLVVMLTGCTGVIKQNIISSIQTGLGIVVCENPQTQLYEVKFGYIRSQFYSVPTGKCINKDGDATSERADVTPEVVSGIKVSTSWKNLIFGADIAENFAVGKEAVRGGPAAAMYVATAEKTETAKKASEAAKSVSTDRLLEQFVKDPGTQKSSDLKNKLQDIMDSKERLQNMRKE